MSNGLEDTIEEISDEIHKEWDIGRIFHGLYRALTIEIIKRLEARKWRYPPELPSDSSWVSISYKWQGKFDIESKFAVGGGYFDGDWYLEGFGKLAPNHMRYKDIFIYAWQPKLKPAPMLEAGQGGGDEN